MTRLASCWPAAARRTSPSTCGRSPSERGMVRPGRLPANAMPEMSFPIGAATLAEIYGSGADDFPLDPDEWEARAKAVLVPGPFDYIAGGAGGESTMRANRDAFARWRLRPAMLAGNQQRDLRVSLLGTASPAPFFLAPVGVLSAAHAEGDLAVARAAAAAGVPLVVSTAASTSMETTAEAMGAAPRWYQLYWANGRDSRCWPRASCVPRTRVGSSTPAFKASLFPTTAAARWMGPSPRSMRWWRCATR